MAAEHLGDGEHHVGGGDAFGQFTGDLEPDDLGDQHRDRLAQHGGLGLDAAHAPAHHAQPVHHRRVGVGAHERVGVGVASVVGEHDSGQVLEVHLVADAHVGGHDAEVVEPLLAPAQEAVALLVALELAVGVDLEGVM